MTINSINILIPLKNEEMSIDNLIKSLKPILEKIKKKTVITLINDHSSDKTMDILKEMQQKFSFLKVYNNKNASGFGNALKYGIEKNEEEAVIIFMGDCSDNPNDIIEYVKYLDEGYDCVFGSRFIKSSKLVNYPFLKLILNRFANYFIQFLFFIKYNDITNAFKAYRKNTLDNCKPIISQHFNINAELSLKSIIRGYKYKVIPISWTNRKVGFSKFNIKEMRNRYLFTIFYVLLEKILLKKDVYKDDKY
jgi:dolichol-phosphate mannosyltransferase